MINVPVGGDDGVFLGDARLDPATDGLLAGAQVTEAPDGLLLVEVGGGRLHPADRDHVWEVLQRILAAQGRRRVGANLQTVELVRLDVQGGGLHAKPALREQGGGHLQRQPTRE